MSGKVVAMRMKKRRLTRIQLFRTNVNSRDSTASDLGAARLELEPLRHAAEHDLERDEDGDAGDDRDERHPHRHREAELRTDGDEARAAGQR